MKTVCYMFLAGVLCFELTPFSKTHALGDKGSAVLGCTAAPPQKKLYFSRIQEGFKEGFL